MSSATAIQLHVHRLQYCGFNDPAFNRINSLNQGAKRKCTNIPECASGNGFSQIAHAIFQNRKHSRHWQLTI